MLSLLARRAVFGAARVSPRSLLKVPIKSPNVLNRTFTSSQSLLFFASRRNPIRANIVSTAKERTTAAKKPRAKPKATRNVAKKAAPKKKKVVPKPKIKPIHLRFRPPPRVFTSYTLFVREKSRGVEKLSFKTHMPRLSEEWKALPESEKESYRQRARAERLQLVEKFNEFMSNADPKLLHQFNRNRRQQGKQAIHRSKGSLPRRSEPPFFLFLSELRGKPEFQSWKITDITREGSMQWRAMSDAEKATYKSQAAEAAAARSI